MPQNSVILNFLVLGLYLAELSAGIKPVLTTCKECFQLNMLSVPHNLDILTIVCHSKIAYQWNQTYVIFFYSGFFFTWINRSLLFKLLNNCLLYGYTIVCLFINWRRTWKIKLQALNIQGLKCLFCKWATLIWFLTLLNVAQVLYPSYK